MNPQFIPQQPFGGGSRQPESSTLNNLPPGVQNLPQGLPKQSYFPSKYGASVPPTTQNSGFLLQNHTEQLPPSSTLNQPSLQNNFSPMQHNGTPLMQPNRPSISQSGSSLNQPPYSFSGEQQSQGFPSRPAPQQAPPTSQPFPSNQPPVSAPSLQGPPQETPLGHPHMQGNLPGPPLSQVPVSGRASLPGQPHQIEHQRPLERQQPPTQLGQQLPPQMGQQPPSQMGQFPPSQMGKQQPPPQMGHQSPQMGHPPLLNQSQLQTGHPPLPGQPPQMGHPPLPGQPPQMGHPPLPGQPPQMGHPPLPGQPPQMGHPPSGQPPQIGHQPLPGQLPQMGHPPASNQLPQIGHPPLPGQPLQMSRPPLPGQAPQMGRPPLLGRPPLSGQPPQLGHPPLPGQPQFQSNYPPQNYQLTNQMQNMSLDSQRQYPGGPNINGDGGPHMPPPVGLQGYSNGQGNMSSYPQMSGPPGGHPNYPQYQQNAAAQQKRLDPDQMPSPVSRNNLLEEIFDKLPSCIQVMQDDKKNRSEVFCTNQRGLVPPLVTTKFVVQDQGNASPRFVRSTMYNVPIVQDLMKQTAIPFGLVISPMARTAEDEYPPPVANFGELGPVRCSRCKAYMCPFMQFVDSGRRFQCLLCKATTDVPPEYFQHLDHTGQRMDRYERPELVLGTYELTATKDYCRNNTYPKPPAFVFIIDVSYNNIKSGLVHLLCSQMKDIIKNLPIDQGMEKSNMRVGFITYNSTVHFYNIKGCLAAPQMMVVGDLRDMFMPLLDGFLCTPEESEIVIDALMEQIPQMFSDTRETETILLPAILAGVEALKASDCTGKLLVFHSSLPIAEAPGKLKNRDDRKLLGTEKEKTILTPQNQDYNKLGQDCIAVGCSVDLFLFNNAYIDVATIGQVARLSGGEVYKYTYFQADLDGERLITDVINDVRKPIAFDAIMRVRTSTGIRPTDVYGHFYMSNTTDIELGSIDCDKGIAVEIKHDDKLAEEEGVFIQVALLYTSCSGQRRLRVNNLSLNTCSKMADLYRSCDLDTLINFFAKQAVWKLLENNPKAVKDNIINRGAQILANYRKNCASPSSSGQLILPECMKLMPLYVNCLLKSDAISGGSDITVDDRSFAMQNVTIMDVPTSVVYFYPRLIPLHEVQPENGDEIPDQIRCSIEKMADHGVYLLENSIHMLIWIGLNVSSSFCQQVFGVQSAAQIDCDKVTIPRLDNPLSEAVHSIIEKIMAQRHRRMRLTLVRQREKLEPIFKHFLVEDRGFDNSSSYVDFLCHMHKEIRTILS